MDVLKYDKTVVVALCMDNLPDPGVARRVSFVRRITPDFSGFNRQVRVLPKSLRLE
jgi:hypothetical protein